MKNMVRISAILLIGMLVVTAFGCGLSNMPPVVTITGGDDPVASGETVTLTANASDADNNTLTYRWFIEETEMDVDTSSLTFTFSDLDTTLTVTVKVVVSDPWASAEATKDVTFTP